MKFLRINRIFKNQQDMKQNEQDMKQNEQDHE